MMNMSFDSSCLLYSNYFHEDCLDLLRLAVSGTRFGVVPGGIMEGRNTFWRLYLQFSAPLPATPFLFFLGITEQGCLF